MIKSKNWWLITIKGLIFIFLGFYILKFPISGMLGLIIYGSISLFISGLVLATFAVVTRKTHKGWGWQMAEGLLDIILAVILLLNIGLTALTLPYVFAFYGIFTGIFWIFQSIFFKNNQYKFILKHIDSTITEQSCNPKQMKEFIMHLWKEYGVKPIKED